VQRGAARAVSFDAGEELARRCPSARCRLAARGADCAGCDEDAGARSFTLDRWRSQLVAFAAVLTPVPIGMCCSVCRNVRAGVRDRNVQGPKCPAQKRPRSHP
jgi:hypothetical protein